MRGTNTLKLDNGTGVTVSIDLNAMDMSDEQRAIMSKLFAKLQDDDFDVSGDSCEEGDCVSSRYLDSDEFEKIRDLRMILGSRVSDGPVEEYICEGCIKCYKV